MTSAATFIAAVCAFVRASKVARAQTVASETCFHADGAGASRWLLLVQDIALVSRPGLAAGDAPAAFAQRIGGRR